MSTNVQEPSLTFHPEQSTLTSALPSLPKPEALVAGARFSAAANAEKQREDAGPLKRTSSQLDVSDVQLEGKRRQVVEDVLECYCCRPTQEIFRRSWREDAIFEDQALKCIGYKEYAAQYYAMPYAFSKARTLSTNVISSTHGPDQPNRIVYEQEQEYTVRLVGTTFKLKSLISLDLDEEDRIVHLTDRWSGKEPPEEYGTYYLRRLTAKSVPVFISVPDY